MLISVDNNQAMVQSRDMNNTTTVSVAARFSQATRDMAHEWLNNSCLALEYACADEPRAEEMLTEACAEIISCERDEEARVNNLGRWQGESAVRNAPRR